MTAYPNPVFRAVLLRVIGPFVPVWMFGLVLALTLNQLGLAGGSPIDIALFAVAFSVVVGGLLAVLLLWERRHAPPAIDLDVEAVGPASPGGSGLPFGAITAIRDGGFFGARVEAHVPRDTDGAGRRLRWLYLTRDNAERLSLALSAWREREAAEATPTA